MTDSGRDLRPRRHDGRADSQAAGRSLGTAGLSALLAEQVAYDSARAPEYDDAYPVSAEPAFVAILDRFCPGGDVLELACGTGRWTPRLLRHARTVTAVDASAEMLAIPRARLVGERVRFVQADIFSWRPGRRYDVAFFAFWLSHVPPARFGAFWSLVASAIKPSGRVLFLDDVTRAAGRPALVASRPGLWCAVSRAAVPAASSKSATKPAILAGRLAQLGWQARVRPLFEHLYWGVSARPLPPGRLDVACTGSG